ncbi:phosphatases II [Phlegmacium glaucopus]|nr:phosphatases II [Phlegmacium glaucopus]
MVIESLAKLASQHHASEYNCSKFGRRGNPTPYLPISIRLPEHFQQLRLQQLLTSHNQAWWPSDCQPSLLSLQDQIMDAMSEPLNPLPPPFFKTSSTHPINISSIVPPEIIALISSHALLSFSAYPRNYPTLLEIPSPFTINRYPDLCDTRLQNKHISLPAAKPGLLAKQAIDSHFCTRPNIADALQAAITSGIEPANDQTLQYNSESGVPPENRVLTTFIPETSLSLSVSMNIPTSTTLHAPYLSPFSDISTRSTKFHNLLSPLNGTLKHIPSPSARNSWDPGHNTLSFSTWVSESGHCGASPYPAASLPQFAIGNLFLSSCPGKKVRLDGPIKGRLGVRRDLETDMRRIKDMGTGCIIWCDLIHALAWFKPSSLDCSCLDDNELEFLGAPWSEYEHCASRTGLDVLRLPIPEGLAPLAPAYLDVHLISLINRYTLRGIPILVHCRGGVGRAGVVACCWAIRLGLCGWVDDPRAPTLTTAEDTFPHDEILTYVERVISFVRRRRSMKAIETYEQVKFLVDYVDYLRHGMKQLSEPT